MGKVVKRNIIFASLAILSLAACDPQISPTVASDDAAPAVSENTAPTVATTRLYRGVRVPLPRGEWQDVGEVANDSFPNFPQRQAVYASVHEGVIDRVVTVWWQERNPPDWFTPFAHCKNRLYPHAVVRRNARNSHSCWHVRPVNLGLAGSAPAINKLLSEFAKRNGLYLPLTMIGVRYVESSGTTRHYVEYLWNVDLLLPTENGSVWRPSDWRKDAVDGAPKRRAVVRALIDWGAAWRPVVMSK